MFGIKQYSGEVNGRGKTAYQLVNLLEKATLKEDLKLLTLLSWSEIFPRKKLIRSIRHWCPACYQDCIAHSKYVYEPLVWSISVVETCPIHKTPLVSHCHHCTQELPPLASNFRVGFCSKCGKWLGHYSQQKTQKKQSLNKTETQWQIYVNENIEKLILASYRLSEPISRNLLSNSFNSCINQITKGNIAAFAKILEIPKNTVWMWSKGKSIPRIDTLLGICYRLNLSILEFLKIDKSQPICLKRVNYDDISNNHLHQGNKSKKIINSEFLRKYLEQNLAQETATPLSLTEIADNLGYNRRVLIRKFPELCQNISQRYIKSKKKFSKNKIKWYCLEVEEIAEQLYSQGIYPSEMIVSQYIDKPGYFRYQEVRNALKNFQDNHI